MTSGLWVSRCILLSATSYKELAAQLHSLDNAEEEGFVCVTTPEATPLGTSSRVVWGAGVVVSENYIHIATGDWFAIQSAE